MIAYYNDGGTLKFRVHLSGDGTNQTVKYLTYTLPLNTWTHLAFVYDSTAASMEVFEDGVSQGTLTGFSGVVYSSGTSPVHIGYSADLGTSYFDGKFDEVRFWNDKRTSTEILNNKTEILDGTEDNLQASWRFSETAVDQTSNDNDLTLNNSPQYDTSDIPFDDGEGSSGTTTSASSTVVTFEDGAFDQLLMMQGAFLMLVSAGLFVSFFTSIRRR